jgi:hypothetical protein
MHGLSCMGARPSAPAGCAVCSSCRGTRQPRMTRTQQQQQCASWGVTQRTVGGGGGIGWAPGLYFWVYISRPDQDMFRALCLCLGRLWPCMCSPPCLASRCQQGQTGVGAVSEQQQQQTASSGGAGHCSARRMHQQIRRSGCCAVENGKAAAAFFWCEQLCVAVCRGVLCMCCLPVLRGEALCQRHTTKPRWQSTGG